VTSRSDTKLEVARSVGADVALNHSRDVVGEIRKITEGRGADVIVDSVGQQSWPQSLRTLRTGGRLIVCGATSGPEVTLDLRRLFWRQWSILGSTLGSLREYAEIVKLAGEGKLRPVVDRVVPWDQAPFAFERLARGEQVGKIVIEGP
jgi:NADPH:quinone reductase-like Zn-dependent oxidoreductase